LFAAVDWGYDIPTLSLEMSMPVIGWVPLVMVLYPDGDHVSWLMSRQFVIISRGRREA
jgi:hypothetical protein